jgi:MoxR-like ATPase
MGTQRAGSISNGDNFGMRGRIGGPYDGVCALGDQFPVADDDGAERSAGAGGRIRNGKFNRALQPPQIRRFIAHVVMIGEMTERETAMPVAAARLPALTARLEGALRGKSEVIRLALTCLLSEGHLLIEDVPGVGKTTLANALARAVDCRFHRLQFTADMLPADVTGVSVYNAHSQNFEFKPGPVFTNFLLADEINRATPRTQSALLEAMNEGQVSVDGVTHQLGMPFMVLATQNPMEHHGTYPLPESQLDRFLMRLRIGYPDSASEREILRRSAFNGTAPAPLLHADDVLLLQRESASVRVDDAIVDYILAIVERTRNHESLSLGVSPRGAQALYRASQSMAYLDGRSFVTPDDVKALAVPVFAHRVALSARAGAQRSAQAAERVLEEILTLTEVPL